MAVTDNDRAYLRCNFGQIPVRTPCSSMTKAARNAIAGGARGLNMR